MPDSIHNPVWDTAIAKVRERSHGSFDAWFAGVQYDGQLGALSSGSPFDGQSANGNSSCSHVGGNTCGNTNSKIQLRARDEFTRDWIKDHFQPAILQEIANAGGFASDIQWTIDPKIENPIGRPRAHAVISQPATSNPPPPSGTQHAAPKPVSAPPAGVNAKYTFANFVVGPSNQLAFAAAAAASGGSGRRYNPLFLCGSTGLGKTHLLHAIALRIHSERPTARIVYGSADSFTNEFIAAISERKMDEFRTRFHQCEAFLVDDVQSLAGRNQTQEEFFNTFNILHACDKQIVLAADKYPKQLDRMEQRLVSRFTWGLVADVQTPEFETRVAIVQKKARLENLDLPDGVAHLLAEAVQSNVRELEGALIRLIAKSSLLGCHLDL
ncbi:MAG: DnaA/Hda family protein, partial [Polyangiaceae bacterium]|nr:DnaA/Hda family protein [Polyangiaceae bacterium]